MRNQLPGSSDDMPRAKPLGCALSVTFDPPLKLEPNTETGVAVLHEPEPKADPAGFVIRRPDEPAAVVDRMPPVSVWNKPNPTSSNQQSL